MAPFLFGRYNAPLNGAPTHGGAPLHHAHGHAALYEPVAHAGSGLLRLRHPLGGHAAPHDGHAAQHRYAHQAQPVEQPEGSDAGLSTARTGQGVTAAAPQPSVAQLALHRAAHANALARKSDHAVFVANTLDANSRDLRVGKPNDPYTIGSAHPSKSSILAPRPCLQQAPP